MVLLLAQCKLNQFDTKHSWVMNFVSLRLQCLVTYCRISYKCTELFYESNLLQLFCPFFCAKHQTVPLQRPGFLHNFEYRFPDFFRIFFHNVSE